MISTFVFLSSEDGALLCH